MNGNTDRAYYALSRVCIPKEKEEEVSQVIKKKLLKYLKKGIVIYRKKGGDKLYPKFT